MQKFYVIGILSLFSIELLTSCKPLAAQLPYSTFADSGSMTQSVLINQPLQVFCSSAQDPNGDIILHYKIKNITNATTVHIFDSNRMPYLILQDDGSLLVLHGVNPPDPERDYYAIEIPITRPVAPGEEVGYQVKLTPLYLSDHYGKHRTPTDLHGSIKVQCQIGWGETPILASERHKKSINFLLDWQRLVDAEPIQVNFP